MPPKKDDKKAKGAAPGEVDPAALVEAYKVQNEALQRQLAERTDKYLQAEKVAETLRTRMKRLEADMVDQEKTTFDITAEMTRQYKAMQETLQTKISALEAEVSSLKIDIASERAAIEAAKIGGSAIANAKDQEIQRLREKMEDMANEFGDMLAEAIRKMADRIEVSPEGYTTGEGEVAARMAEIASGARI